MVVVVVVVVVVVLLLLLLLLLFKSTCAHTGTYPYDPNCHHFR